MTSKLIEKQKQNKANKKTHLMCLTNVIKTYRNSFTSWIGRNFLFSWDFLLLSLLPPTFVSHRVWIKEMILFSGLFSRNLKRRKKQTSIRKTDPNQSISWRGPCSGAHVELWMAVAASQPGPHQGRECTPLKPQAVEGPGYCPSSDMESPQPLLLPHCT